MRLFRSLLLFSLIFLTGLRTVCAEDATTLATKVVDVQGKVVDSTGAIIPQAAVSLTDLATNTVTHTTTDSAGNFIFRNVLSGPKILSVQKSGFESFTLRFSPATQQSITATLQVAKLNDSVIVRGTVDPEASPVPTREDVMVMPETVRVLDRKQLDAAGPVAGGAQMVQSTPGANVIGYGNTGGQKYTILLNGIQQGWAGEATSFTAPGSLGITYDGIPVADPATGLWQSATMPQNLVIQDVQVNYGPGPAAERWYTDEGGRIEFTPIQPTVDRHLSVAATDGSSTPAELRLRRQHRLLQKLVHRPRRRARSRQRLPRRSRRLRQPHPEWLRLRQDRQDLHAPAALPSASSTPRAAAIVPPSSPPPTSASSNPAAASTSARPPAASTAPSPTPTTTSTTPTRCFMTYARERMDLSP